ncbi:unnamed protein product, partial [Iphiclides podalirius]
MKTVGIAYVALGYLHMKRGTFQCFDFYEALARFVYRVPFFGREGAISRYWCGGLERARAQTLIREYAQLGLAATCAPLGHATAERSVH